MQRNEIFRRYGEGGGKSFLCFTIIIALCLSVFHFSLPQTVSAADSPGGSYVSSLSVQSQTDGTSPWDPDDEPGNDSGESNLSVRSFDDINYTLSYTTALTDTSVPVDSGDLCVAFTLPCAPDVATFNMDTMNWMSGAVTTYYFKDGTNGTSYDDPGDVSYQVLAGYRTLSNASTQTIPGAGTLSVGIYVGAAQDGAAIQPVFTAWMDGNTDSQKVTAVPEAVTVSAALKLTVQISTPVASLDLYGSYDLSTGNSDAAQDLVSRESTVTGRLEGYGITVLMENDTLEKGLRGLQFPEGAITFDITLEEDMYSSAGENVGLTSGWTPVLWEYDENDKVSNAGEWGRGLQGTYKYAIQRAPWNILGANSNAVDGNSIYDGGDWTIVQDAADPLTYHVTITDYDINMDGYSFPTANCGSSTTSYQDNQACISAAYIQCILQCPSSSSTDVTVYFDITASGLAVDDEGLDGSWSYGRTYNLVSASGSITGGVWFTETTNNGVQGASDILASTFKAGDGYSFLGNTVRLWHRWTVTSETAVRTGITLTKFDADAFEIADGYDGGTLSRTGKNTLTIYGYTTYYAGRSENWASEQEMSDTLMNSTSLHYYADLDDLEADGYVCVGMLCVSDISYTGSAGDPSAQYNIDLTIKGTAAVGEVYAACGEEWGSYSSVDPMVPVNGSSSEYKMDQDLILDYDMYRCYASVEASAAMGFKRSTDAYYIKTAYDSDGNIVSGTNVTAFYGGDSLLVCSERTSVEISVANTDSSGGEKSTYDMDAGERTATYTVQPYCRAEGSLSSESGDNTTTTTTVTVKVTLPDGLTYDTGSAYYGSLAIIPEAETDSDGNTVLVFTVENVTVGTNMDAITFTCTIGHAGTLEDVVNNQTLTATATIGSDGDSRTKIADFGNYSTTTVTVIKLLAVTIAKAIDSAMIELDGSFSWDFSFMNESSADLAGAVLADVLPQDGDGLGSSFSGSYEVTAITVDFSDAADSFAADQSSMAFYVSTDSGLSGESLVQDGMSGTWAELVGTADGSTVTYDVSPYGGMTAFYYELGILGAMENIQFTVSVRTSGNECGDVYRNLYYESGSGQSSYVQSNQVAAQVVQRTLSGLAWLDENGDGIRGGNEPLLPDVEAALYSGDMSSGLTEAVDVYGNTVASVTTGADGSYSFTNLPAGTYTVVFSGVDGDVYTLTTQDAGDNDAVDSDAADGSGTYSSSQVIAGITLPGIGDMDRYYYESMYNDAGYAYVVKYWQITVTKLDAALKEEGAAQAGATLEGAVYGLYDAGSLAATYTTDGNGQFTTDYQPCGDNWYIREISPSIGYTLDETIYYIDASFGLFTDMYNEAHLSEGSYTEGYEDCVFEEPLYCTLTAIKYKADGSTLAGVTFQLQSEDGSVAGEGTTGSSGTVTFTGIVPGSYVLCETGTADGYTLLAEDIAVTLPVCVSEEYTEENGIDTSDAVYDEAAGTYYFYSCTYEVTDHSVLMAPNAGNGPALPLFGAAGAGILAGSVLLSMKKRFPRAR